MLDPEYSLVPIPLKPRVRAILWGVLSTLAGYAIFVLLGRKASHGEFVLYNNVLRWCFLLCGTAVGARFFMLGFWGGKQPEGQPRTICPKCETPYAYSELTNGMCPVCLVKVVDTKEYFEQAKEGGTGGAPDAGEVGDKGAAENTDGLSGESGQPLQPPSGEA